MASFTWESSLRCKWIIYTPYLKTMGNVFLGYCMPLIISWKKLPDPISDSSGLATLAYFFSEPLKNLGNSFGIRTV
jgi:hypothetical protein